MFAGAVALLALSRPAVAALQADPRRAAGRARGVRRDRRRRAAAARPLPAARGGAARDPRRGRRPPTPPAGRRRARRGAASSRSHACSRRCRQRSRGLRARCVDSRDRRAVQADLRTLDLSGACPPLSAVTYRQVPLVAYATGPGRRRGSSPTPGRGAAIVIPRSARAVESLQSASDDRAAARAPAARLCDPRPVARLGACRHLLKRGAGGTPTVNFVVFR